MSAETMVQLIIEVALLCGEPLKNKAGQNRFGKHSWRATGAVHLAECGVEIAKITLIGRWHCSIVLLYTRTAPISNIAEDYKRARSSTEVHNTVKNMEVSFKKVRALVEKATIGLNNEIATLNNKLVAVEKHAKPTFVINARTGRWHRILVTFADAGVEAIAYCGYAYAKPSARCRFTSEMPDDTKGEDICKTCLGEERARREH